MLRLFFILSFILPSILYAGDVQDFYSLRKTLLESKNNEKRIEAAQRLANEYPLKESLNILEAALEIELNKIHEGKKPGFSKVIAYNEAVKAIATSGNRELVERLIQKMKDGQESISRLHSPSSFEKMIAPLKEALESLREGELQNFNEFFGIEAQTVSIPKTSLSTSEISEALKSKRKQSFNTINSQLSSRDAGVITGGTSTFINDSIVERMLNNPTFSIYGRDAESEKLIKTLLRIKGPHPLLLGPSGAGKTAIVEKIAELIARDEIPDNPLYKQELEGVHILETTPARLKMLGKKSLGVELYFDALSRGVENGFKFIVFIDEIHNLDKEQKEAMKRYLSGENGIKLIGATTSEEWQLSTKDNEAFQRRFREIGVQELNKEQTFEILSKSWRPRVEDYYKVSISDETLKIVIQNAKRVHKEGGLIDATINVMQDLSIDSIPLVESTEKTPLTVEMVYKFFNKQLGFPVDPLNAKALNEYINGLNQKLEKKVINQDRMIKTVTGEWKKLLKDQQRKVRVVLMLGPTGVGKTRLAEKFTEITFDNPKAMLEINGNEYKEGANEARTLLGAPPGVVSSKERSGSLMDFLDDPGKGKNGGVLLINEFEKMHEEIRQMMMEFFDKGRITGKDGKLREANNLMILLTSNRGDEVIYPDGIEKWSESDISSYLAKYDKEKLKNLFLQNTGENDTFRMTNPEVQRIDAIVPANPLSEKMADDIAKLVSNELGQNLERDLGIKVSFSDELIHYLAMQQYSMVDGARNMERFVKDNLSDAIDASIEKLSLERGSEIELTLKTEAKKYFIAYESNSKKGAFSLPEAKISEPFENPKTLRIIGRLEGGELEKYVFGQEEALKSVKNAVISHLATPASKKKRPLSLLLLGTTGTGKTETGKALSQILYDSSERAEVVPLGSVKNEASFKNIFGGDINYVGTDKISPFEKALRKNPDGGIIVMDEVTNMGGNDKALKNDLMKRLYDIIEEGKWKSNATHVTYDLSNYIFIFTGNDGEEYFRGVSADQRRLAIWQEMRSKSQLQEMLVEKGAPEAWLGRLMDIILMRPLVEESKVKISGKFLDDFITGFESRGLEVKFSDDLYRQLADSFFSHKSGGRSVRNIIEHHLNSLVATQIAKLITEKKIEGLSDAVVEISLKTESIGLNIVDNLENYKPASAVLDIKVLSKASSEELITQELEITEHIANSVSVMKSSLEQTAYHEAGHAIANFPEHTGQVVTFITVNAADEYNGYASYSNSQIRGLARHNLETMKWKLVRLAAGQVAMEVTGSKGDMGWSSDLEKMRKTVMQAVVDGALEGSLLGIYLDDKGNPVLSELAKEKFEKISNKFINEAKVEAKKILEERRNLLEAVASKLMDTKSSGGAITGEEFYQMAREYKHSYMQGCDVFFRVGKK